eukprot:scaffold17309_cov65-Phaeocystis_antarctica.AAC.3
MAGAFRACDCSHGWDAHNLQGGAGWASRFARLAREVEAFSEGGSVEAGQQLAWRRRPAPLHGQF